MKVFDSLTRTVQEVKPLTPGHISLYTCGPTVYSYYHVGNLRNAVFNDSLRRALESEGYSVKQVMNITDVGHLTSDQDDGEDKLEAGAKKDNKTVWEVADFYIAAFIKDMSALNVLTPNGYQGKHAPYARATDFIEEQLNIVKILIDKGYAYQTEQAIYFDVSKLSDYGKLTGQALADKEVAARPEVVTDNAKRNAQDFALWFFKVSRFADHTMHWPSSWGEGFPGWHLECSAIIHATLGEPIDIHTGGVDHIGTHHTNEIAQTEAAFGVKLAKYWVHNEHLLVDGQKMSKSKGNFITLVDVVSKGYEPLALRLFFLQSHYRSQANFSWELLDAAQARLNSYKAMSALRWQALDYRAEVAPIAEDMAAIHKALSDDLNTPEALARLSQLDNRLQTNLLSKNNLEQFNSLINDIDSLLGLDLAKTTDINDEQKLILNHRQKAKTEKNWPLSDSLRDQLAKQGVLLRDTSVGQIWYRQ